MLARQVATPSGRDPQGRHHGRKSQEIMRDLRELNINEGGRLVGRATPSIAELREFESAFGVKLPDEYVSLLQYSNGGHPELNSFRAQGAEGDPLWGVNRFYHLTGDKSDLEGLWRASKEWQPVTSKKHVPVANDGGGNQILLSYESTPPSVKLCLHNQGFRLLHVADSFGQFIDLLAEDPDMI